MNLLATIPTAVAGQRPATDAGLSTWSGSWSGIAAAARSWTGRRLIISGFALAAAIVAGTTVIISVVRNDTLADSNREVTNVALMLAGEYDRSFQAVELLEKNLIGRIQRLGVTSSAEMEQRLAGVDAHVLLQDVHSGLPQVASVAIINARGRAVASSRAWPIPVIDVSDRDYYKALTANPELTSFLSAPVRNRVDRTRSIFLARKILGSNNELLGFVIAGMELRSFEDYFGSIALGDGAEIALVRGDGTLFAHYPPLDQALERKDDQGPLFESKALRPGSDAAHVVAIHSLSQFQAYVWVSAATSAVLANWRTQAVYLGGTAFLTILVIGGIVFIALRRLESHALIVQAREERSKEVAAQSIAEVVVRERQHAREQLDEQKLQLVAATNNMPQGLVMFDSAACLVVCNQNYMQMYQLPPEAVKPGTSLRHPRLSHPKIRT